MGDDEYHPISGEGTNLTKAGGIGYTVIDSIDTMQIMGLKDEYARARHWVATKMSFDRDDNFSTFEVNFDHTDITLLCHLNHEDHYSRSRRPAVCVSSVL